MPFVQVNGAKIHYEISGTGPKLLFIHGIGADLKNPVGASNSPLPQHFTVLAFDPRGLGESDDSNLPGSIAEMADDAAGLASALGWDQYYLFGASMGGMVAQELVLRHPEAVQKMALIVTNAGGKSAAPAAVNKMYELSTAEMLRLSDIRQDDAWIAANPEKVRLAEQKFLEFWELIRSNPALRRGYDNQAQAVLKHDTFDRLPQINVPTLVLAGLYDGGNPFEAVRAMAEQITGARFEPVDSGHGDWYFNPTVWKMIIDFLRD